MPTAIYARVSTDTQEERQTIDSQLHLARAHCHAQGIEAEEYIDDGVSGMLGLGERPAGARLLADVEAGSVTRVLVYKLDRLGRGNDARDLLNSVFGLEELGATVVSLTEMIDTSTPAGRLFLTMLAGYASFERDVFLERSRAGTERVARMGKWLGGIVPFGYRCDEEGYLQINEEPIPGTEYSEADVIRLMYRLMGEGATTQRVAEHLNTLRIPTAYQIDGRQRGKRAKATQGVWRAGRIRNILVQPIYRGEHHYGRRSATGRETIARQVPAIVGAEAWERAQQQLRANQLGAMRNTQRDYLLRGLIRCASCGRVYHGTQFPGPGRERIVYYQCGGKNKVHAYPFPPCKSKNLRAEEIEGRVWEECLRILTDPTTVEAYLERAVPAPASPVDAEREGRALVAAIEENGKEKERLITIYRRGLITDEELTEQLRQVDGERQAIQERQGALRLVQREVVRGENQRDALEARLAELRPLLAGELGFAARRRIVSELVDRITVTTIGEGSGRWHLSAEVEVVYRIAGVVA